jgi:RNA polymerase sigma factor (TIGR02999 family)
MHSHSTPKLHQPQMTEITQILSRIDSGEPEAAAQLLPLVYDELRKLAAARLAHEKAGHTLQATALVHEAYLRLVGSDISEDSSDRACWDGRGHFFAAAAESMRRILIENARRKLRHKHGGGRDKVELPRDLAAADDHPERLLELDAALDKLATTDPTAAEVVKLHFFAGQSLEVVGQILGMSRASAYRQWAYARSWLKLEIENA